MSKKAQSTDKTPAPAKIFKPRTLNQTDCVISIAENVVTIITGMGGTGKTAIAAGMAVSYLNDGKVDKIFVTRPMVQCGRRGGGIGLLPGDVASKYGIFALPVLLEIERYLGGPRMRSLLASNNIEVLPLDLTRGRSLADTFIIVDETQNATHDQLDMILTRIDKGSKIVLTGDLEQTDLPDYEAMAFQDLIDDLDGLPRVGICNLTRDDIQRHPIIGDIMDRRREGRAKRK